MKILFFPLPVIALILTAHTAHSMGIAALKQQAFRSNESAKIFIFERAQLTANFVRFHFKDRAPFSTIRSGRIEYVEIVNTSSNNLLKEKDIEPYRKNLAACEAFAKKYKKALPHLEVHMRNLRESVKSFDNSMVRHKGRWMSKDEFESTFRNKTKVKESQNRNQALQIKTKSGSTYNKSSIVRYSIQGIRVVTETSIKNVKWNDLDEPSKKLLNYPYWHKKRLVDEDGKKALAREHVKKLNALREYFKGSAIEKRNVRTLQSLKKVLAQYKRLPIAVLKGGEITPESIQHLLGKHASIEETKITSGSYRLEMAIRLDDMFNGRPVGPSPKKTYEKAVTYVYPDFWYDEKVEKIRPLRIYFYKRGLIFQGYNDKEDDNSIRD